jgi:copper chaperone
MITLRVGGMSCQGCVVAVTRAVEGATQAAPVQVDLERGEVTLGAGTDRAAAADAIRRAGFTVEG